MTAAFLLSVLSFLGAGANLAGASAGFSIRTEHPSYLLGEPIYLRISSSQARPPSLEEYALVLGVAPLPESRKVRKATKSPRLPRLHKSPKSPGSLPESQKGPTSASMDAVPETAETFYHPPLRLRTHSPDADGEDTLATRPNAAVPHARFARLIANDGGLLFPKPGRYRLLLHSGSAIVSDSATVAILSPSAPEDRRAFALIAGNPGEYALAVYLEGGDQLKEGMAIIRGLAGFRSAYTRAAAFVLASDWSQDYTDFRGGASRPADLEKALGLAQWDPKPGWYIPLRIAYRLRTAATEVAARDPAAPGLAAVRERLHDFEASLPPEADSLYRSF